MKITILDDGALEGNETFAIATTTSDPDVKIQVTGEVTTFTIVDNDG